MKHVWKPPVWAVASYEDYSGTRIFQTQEEAWNYARKCSDDRREPAVVYACNLTAIASPAPSTLSPYSPPTARDEQA